MRRSQNDATPSANGAGANNPNTRPYSITPAQRTAAERLIDKHAGAVANAPKGGRHNALRAAAVALGGMAVIREHSEHLAAPVRR